jgi:arginyl-tRNA synthetase
MTERTLQEKTAEIIEKIYQHDIDPAQIGIEKTKKEIEGDFTIVVFPLSKLLKSPPEAIANRIGEELKKMVNEIQDFNVIKGFLNIILKDSFWLSFLYEKSADPSFGFQPQRTNEPPVLVEFSSPNTNKPLHLGHIRNNLLGFSVAKILQANGHKVIRLNLVNDRGIHICKSMLAYMKWSDGETPESSGMKSDHLIGKYYVLFERNYRKEIQELTEKGISAEDAAKQAPLILEAQEILRKWEKKDKEILVLWSRMNGWTYHGFEETYNKLGIVFDKVQYESDTYLHGKDIVMEGLKNGFLVQKEDGSVWADLRDGGLDEKLLLRGDGTSVYITQDLGTAVLRYTEFNPSLMVYVVGNEQNYHFDVLKRILEKTGHSWAERIFHLSYGMVELPEGKMKSREGTVVDADDLVEEMIRTAEETTNELGKLEDFSSDEAKNLFRILGLGALKYFILKVDPKKNMLFDPKESIDFNGNTGPFLQYTYARIQSLLRKAGGLGYKTVPEEMRFSSMVLSDLLPQERQVLKLLYQFPGVVISAGQDFNPSDVANYIYEVGKEYNQFYQEIPVLREESKDRLMIRLIISILTGRIIKQSMDLLGIEMPERM